MGRRVVAPYQSPVCTAAVERDKEISIAPGKLNKMDNLPQICENGGVEGVGGADVFWPLVAARVSQETALTRGCVEPRMDRV